MKKIISISSFFVVWCSCAFAAAPPTVDETVAKMRPFQQMLKSMITAIMTDSDLNNFVDIIWTAFAIYLLVGVLIKFMHGILFIHELVHALLLIIFAKVCIDYYDYITSVFWSWSEALAGGTQKAIFGSSDPFLLFAFIHDINAAITINGISFLDGLNAVVMGILMVIIMLLLSVLSFLASAWAMWGYALAKLIGWFFIPFIMLRKTSFLFDGWVRFFLGFLVYGLVARVNLILTATCIRCFLGLPGYSVGYTIPNTLLDVQELADVSGLVAFVFISILSLCCTGKFASTIVSGAGGFGEGIQTMAFSISRFMGKIR